MQVAPDRVTIYPRVRSARVHLRARDPPEYFAPGNLGTHPHLESGADPMHSIPAHQPQTHLLGGCREEKGLALPYLPSVHGAPHALEWACQLLGICRAHGDALAS